MFESLSLTPADGILAIMTAFRADTRPNKIDLGVGVYRDSSGNTPILASVREAEQRLHNTQTTKAYVGMAGDIEFNNAIADMIFAEHKPVDRLRMAQTPGGSGGLRALTDLLARANPTAKVWVSDPTWANHIPIIKASGFEISTYPYFDAPTGSIKFGEMCAALRKMSSNDIVVLHGCCHNPTGANLSNVQWDEVVSIAAERGFLPFIDFAYQGFGDGLDEDAYGARRMVQAVPEMVVAASCSKNFGLYRDRVGTSFVIAKSSAQADITGSQLLSVIRCNYSMPPDHGGAVVKIILQDAELKNQWHSELADMRNRMLGLRNSLATALSKKSGSDRFDFVAKHRGMFSLLGISAEQVQQLRDEHAIYMIGDSRMNIAGLSEESVERFADALVSVIG